MGDLEERLTGPHTHLQAVRLRARQTLDDPTASSRSRSLAFDVSMLLGELDYSAKAYLALKERLHHHEA